MLTYFLRVRQINFHYKSDRDSVGPVNLSQCVPMPGLRQAPAPHDEIACCSPVNDLDFATRGFIGHPVRQVAQAPFTLLWREPA